MVKKVGVDNDKIYALIIESGEVTFLSVQCASSLEEAFTLARMEYARMTMVTKGNEQPKSLTGAKIGLFTIKEFDDIKREVAEFRKVRVNIKKKFQEVAQQEAAEPPKVVDKPAIVKPSKKTPKKENAGQKKNNLMKKIIKDKNLRLFQKNKSEFTGAEIEYIQAQLKKQVKD